MSRNTDLQKSLKKQTEAKIRWFVKTVENWSLFEFGKKKFLSL